MCSKHSPSNIWKTVPWSCKPALTSSLPKSSQAPACVFQCWSLFLATQVATSAEKIRILLCYFSFLLLLKSFFFSLISFSSLISKNQIKKSTVVLFTSGSVYYKSTMYQKIGLQSTKNSSAHSSIVKTRARAASPSPPIANLRTQRHGAAKSACHRRESSIGQELTVKIQCQ